MIIRNATMEDMPQILAMGECFYKTTCYADAAPFCADSVSFLADHLIHHGVLLVADDGELKGVLGLVLSPYPMNNKYLAAYEALFWLAPECREARTGYELLHEADMQCKEAGVNSIHQAHMAKGSVQAQKLYELNGYVRSEICYTKVM